MNIKKLGIEFDLTNKLELELVRDVIKRMQAAGQLPLFDVPPQPEPPIDTPDEPQPIAWGGLRTSGNKILDRSNNQWQGRGVVVFDTRSCDAGTWNVPNVTEVKRLINHAVNVMGANFIRLATGYMTVSGGRQNYLPADKDPVYLAHLHEIAQHCAMLRVPLMLCAHSTSYWDDTDLPTINAIHYWSFLAEQFQKYKHVIFDCSGEPHGADEEITWGAYYNLAQAVRSTGARNPIVVPGLTAWGRKLEYYIDHPMPLTNIIYGTHPYNQIDEFKTIVAPHKVLPIIVGEFGPNEWMSITSAEQAMNYMDANGISWAAWSLHFRCPPNLLIDYSGGGPGHDMQLELSSWGETVLRALMSRETSAPNIDWSY